MRLRGKKALVTGAGQGIGRVVAIALAKEGADVIVNVHQNVTLAEEVTAEIKSMGRQALTIKTDVSRSDEVARMVEQAISQFQRIDILVNNAAPADRARVLVEEDGIEVEWNKLMNVVLNGTFLCSKAVGYHMIKQMSGKIINVASIAGHVVIPARSAYCVSKAAVLHLTRVLAVEWGKYNINVNSVSPDWTMIPRWEQLAKQYPERFQLERYAIKRFNKPEDVASAVIFLASAESDNITGQDIIIDSGVNVLWSGYSAPNE